MLLLHFAENIYPSHNTQNTNTNQTQTQTKRKKGWWRQDLQVCWRQGPAGGRCGGKPWHPIHHGCRSSHQGRVLALRSPGFLRRPREVDWHDPLRHFRTQRALCLVRMAGLYLTYLYLSIFIFILAGACGKTKKKSETSNAMSMSVCVFTKPHHTTTRHHISHFNSSSCLRAHIEFEFPQLVVRIDTKVVWAWGFRFYHTQPIAVCCAVCFGSAFMHVMSMHACCVQRPALLVFLHSALSISHFTWRFTHFFCAFLSFLVLCVSFAFLQLL